MAGGKRRGGKRKAKSEVEVTVNRPLRRGIGKEIENGDEVTVAGQEKMEMDEMVEKKEEVSKRVNRSAKKIKSNKAVGEEEPNVTEDEKRIKRRKRKAKTQNDEQSNDVELNENSEHTDHAVMSQEEQENGINESKSVNGAASEEEEELVGNQDNENASDIEEEKRDTNLMQTEGTVSQDSLVSKKDEMDSTEVDKIDNQIGVSTVENSPPMNDALLEQLEVSRAEQKDIFDKVKLLKQIDQELAPENNDEEESPRRYVSRAEQILDELLSLRTTEAEFLLNEMKKTTSASEASNALLVKSLREQLRRAEESTNTWANREKELLDTISELREKTAIQTKKIADLLGDQLESEDSKISNVNGKEHPANQEDTSSLSAQLDLYKLITGLSVQSKAPGSYDCTLKNLQKRKVVKFSLHADATDGKIVYTPTANIFNFPQDLRISLSVSTAMVPALIASIQQAMFCVEESQENAPPLTMKKGDFVPTVAAVNRI